VGLDPIVWFFVFGLLAGLAKAELRLPSAIYDFLSTILLLAIGLKGGVELAKSPASGVGLDVAVVIAMGVVLTVLAFALLRLGRLPRHDAAAIAAHYGSVSVATFAVGISYLARHQITFEPTASVFLVVLEVPAILVGILLARGASQPEDGARGGWRELVHEVLLGRGIILLIGGLLIGWVSGPDGVAPIAPFFFDLFKGVLALFLLEMGLIAAGKLGGFLKYGVFLTAFAVATPLLFSFIGIATAMLIELSPGGAILLATLAASASYIAVPAAMRTAIPAANPAMSLTAALAITFPFNVVFGIPLYHRMVEWLYG